MHMFCSILLRTARESSKDEGIRVGKLSITGDPKCYFIQEQQEDGSWSQIVEITKADCATEAKAKYILQKLARRKEHNE